MQRANNRPTCYVLLPVAVARAPPIAPVRVGDARQRRTATNERPKTKYENQLNRLKMDVDLWTEN